MTRKAGSGVYKKTLQIKVKPDMHEKLLDIAKGRGEDVSKVVRKAIQSEIEYDQDKRS